MSKTKLFTTLVFLTITYITAYLFDEYYLLRLVLFASIIVTLILIYLSNQEFKIVIHKRKLKNKVYKRNLNNYYVMFVELSNLNTYSQFYDIEISDVILKKVFKMLRRNIPKNQLFIYSTDQIVIIQEFKNNHVINMQLRYDEQYRNASKLLHFLKQNRYKFDEHNTYDINVNIGVGSQGIQKKEKSINDLIRLAHFSMIKSQDSKKDIVVADEELRTIKIDLDSFNQEIEHGFKLDEFSPFFLPIIDVNTMKVVGCESLVRWRKNQYRVIEASKFKEIAIEKKLFEKIDKRVIEKTFANYQTWLENDLVDEDFRITINLSYNSLVSVKPAELIKLAKEYGIKTSNVDFDISDESATSEDGVDAISRLKDQGFKVSLDTFSKRCFSFQSLLDIEIDTIKIDKSNLPIPKISEDERKFYESIVRFSKSMNLKILSKGIENKHHLELAQQLNVDYAQGYYFTPPLDDEKIVIYLNKYKEGILTH